MRRTPTRQHPDHHRHPGTRRARTRRTLAAGVAALGIPLLAACGSSGPASTTGGSGAAGYPVTVDSCGHQVSVAAPPRRVVLLKSAPVPYLAPLGVLGTVTAKAGTYPPEYFDGTTRDTLAKVPSLTDKVDTSGHLQISKETILAQQPDLVLGLTETVNPQTLAATKVPLIENPFFCEKITGAPGFDSVYAQLTTYGKVFGRQQQAAAEVTRLKREVAAVTEAAPRAEGRTAAVLYPTVGGGTTYAYGRKSMADPQLRAAGLTNVFGGVDERVFEVSAEQLLAKDPDAIVLLHSDGDPEAVRKALVSLPGADRLRAVRSGHVHVQLLNFTEPPTPLAVEGLRRIERAFADVR